MSKTTKSKELNQEVINLFLNFHTEKKYAISMQDLALAFNTTTRQIRSIIEEIRTNHIPLDNKYCLVSHNEGYWLTCDEKDIEQWLYRYLGTAKTQFSVAKQTIKQLNREKQAKIQGEFSFE